MAMATASGGPSELDRDQQLGEDLREAYELLCALADKPEGIIAEEISRFRRLFASITRIVELNGTRPDSDLHIRQNNRIFLFISEHRTLINALLEKARQLGLGRDADGILVNLEWLENQKNEFYSLENIDPYLQTR